MVFISAARHSAEASPTSARSMQRFAESSSGWLAQASLYGVLSLLNIESHFFFVRISSARPRGPTSAVSYLEMPCLAMVSEWTWPGGGRTVAIARGAMPMARRKEVSFIVVDYRVGWWVGFAVLSNGLKWGYGKERSCWEARQQAH